MKIFHKKLGVVGWLLLLAVTAFAGLIGDNVLIIGENAPSNDREIQMGNGRIKWDGTLSKMRFSNDLGSSFKDIGSGGGSGGSGLNLLAGDNNDFESGNPPVSWTASGGTFVAETINPAFGLQSGSWDSSAASENLDSVLKAIPLGLENRKCNATIQYKYNSGLAGDYKFQVVANTAGVVAEKDLNLTVDWQKEALQFTCPSSDSLRVRITSTTNGQIILIDEVTLGRSDIVNISQTDLIVDAFYPGTTNCSWQRATTSMGAFSADADCPAITVLNSSVNVDTTDDDLPTLKITDLPPGKYVVTATAHCGVNVANDRCALAINDGTTTGPAHGGALSDTNTNHTSQSTVIGVFEYTDSATRTFEIFGNHSTGTMDLINTPAYDTHWTVVRYPLNDPEALTLETTGWKIDVSIGGANVSGSGTTTAHVELTDPGLDLVVNPGSLTNVEVPCSGVNGSNGLTCSSGNESLGVVFTPPQNGSVFVCMSFSHQQSVVSAGAMDTTFKIVETPNNAQTVIQDGKTRISNNLVPGAVGVTSTHSKTVTVCDFFTFDTIGKKTLRLFHETSNSGGNSQAINLDRTVGGRDLHISIFPIDNQFPTPVFTDLTNSLKKKLNGPDDISQDLITGSADVTCGASVINAQTGTWLSSIGNISAGACTLTTSGTVSAWIGCNATEVGNANPNKFYSFTSPTTGANGTISVDCDLDGGGDCTTSQLYISCTWLK